MVTISQHLQMTQLLTMMRQDDKSHLCMFHSILKDPVEYFASIGEFSVIVVDILLVRVK